MWVLTKLLTKNIPHTFIRNGYYYFSRRVPSDLQDHYSYHRIVRGLHTTSPQRAKVQASITAAKLEAYWNQMRLAKSDVIGMSLIKEPSSGSLKVVLSRFSSGLFRAMFAMKEIENGKEIHRRVSA